jgi:serine/threonine-protein kinase RsbW
VEKNLYEIKIPSTQDHLAEAETFLEDSFRENGVDDDMITDLAISATELINNAIIHGNKSDPNKSVTIVVEFSNNSLTISITDQGQGFIPTEIPNPIADENLLKETGRGIFIVRSLVDDLHFEISPEGGTRMIIIKKLAS